MKKRIYFLSLAFLVLGGSLGLQAQIKIGDNPTQISPYALLELESATQGLLIPRISSAERDAAFDANAPIGTLIYNTDTNQLQYLHLIVDPVARTESKTWEPATDGVATSSSVGTMTLETPGSSGSLFYHEANNQLYVYNGLQEAWLPISGPIMITNETIFQTNQIHYTQSDGSTATLSLDRLATSTDSQTLTVSPLDADNQVVFTLTNAVTQTLDLSALASATLVAGPVGPQGPAGPPGPAGTAGSSTDSQTLSVSALSAGNTVTIAISDGNTQTLDLSTLADGSGTDSQTLSISALSAGNTVTVAISGGNTQTLDLSTLADGSGIDSQTLSVSALSAGNTVTIAISDGNTQTLDLSTLADGSGTDSQTLSVSALSAGNTVTIAISDGNTQTLDLSYLAQPTVFITQGGVTSNASGTTATDDFVFGSNQLDNQTGADDDARFFFDKSKGAFRAGYASGNSWDTAQVGDRSIALGYRTEASGDRTTALGNTTEAQSYAETVLGSYNTTVTPNSTSTWNANDRLLVVGNGSSSSTKSDAVVILKNGNTTLNGELTLDPTGTSSYTLPTHKGAAGQVLAIDNATSGTTTWTSAGGGELQRITESGNTGYRLAVEPAANHGDIGVEAVDLSIQIAASATTGARGNYSFAAGRNTTASGIHSFAFGDGTQAIANHSTAWGRDTKASNFDATAWGRETNATGQRSTAWGDNSTAAALLATAWGDSTAATANYTTAWGRSSIASASYSTAFGEEITAESYGQTSFGLYNTPHPGTPNATASVAGDRLLVIGNVTGTAARSDALVILKNGNTTLNGELTLDPTGTSSYTLPTHKGTAGQVLAIDNATSGTTTWTSAEGGELQSVTESGNTGYRLADATAAHHSDIGNNAIDLSIQDQASTIRGASGDFAFAAGNRTVASGDYSTVFGFDSTASGNYSTAFGEETAAEAYAQTTLGHNSTLHPGTPNATGITATDRLLVVGNGTTASTRSDALVILKNGSIGIGDSTPTEGTLVVSGTIVSSGSMTANATLTPDYVFESYFNGVSEANPTYRFPSLTEIESFVKENHHLPNVPSAAEVEAQGGIVLNRASEVQLEKIEELYLHTIEQQKQLEAQQKEIDQLKTMIKILMKEKKFNE